MLQKLTTTWGENLNGMPWDVYPRPQMKRESYVNLNGEWDFSAEDYCGKILVPFCPESDLSCVGRHFPEGATLIYKRRFRLPEDFCQGRVLLHVGAADQTAEVFVNGICVGTHEDGYTSFSFDITHALKEDNELVITCTDDLRDQSFPYGKQTMKRGGMWYTPVSGIWQTVWLESVPYEYVKSLEITTTETTATITVTPPLSGTVVCDGKEYPLTEGKAEIAPETIRLWSPEDPWLYDFTLTAGEDKIESYFALRTIEIEEINGINRILLNKKPYFFHGVLDQGYFPDGIYTPASPECFADDIAAMKKMGFNTLRKHIKVEPEQFYYLCDKLGMIVFQDMVNNGDYDFVRDTALPLVFQKRRDLKMHRDEKTRKKFLETAEKTVKQLKNHPCIVYWTIFNEGWGQFDSDRVYRLFRKWDDTRIIDSTSGWFRRKNSDVDSRHIYFTPWSALQPSSKPLMLSEFGGYACPIPEHIFNPERAFGYRAYKDPRVFQTAIEKLYRGKVLPAIKRGLCGAICTQLSDVEDEINGFLTYDRKVCKADPDAMAAVAKDLQKAIEE